MEEATGSDFDYILNGKRKKAFAPSFTLGGVRQEEEAATPAYCKAAFKEARPFSAYPDIEETALEEVAAALDDAL